MQGKLYIKTREQGICFISLLIGSLFKFIDVRVRFNDIDDVKKCNVMMPW